MARRRVPVRPLVDSQRGGRGRHRAGDLFASLPVVAHERGSDARRWLFTICRNAFLRTRERARHQVELEDGDVEAVASQVAENTGSASGDDRLLTRLDLGPALSQALGRLAEPFRSAVTLVDVEDQSYDAAAEILGVPIGTVRSRLFRGRRLLQQMLTEYARDAGLPTPITPAVAPGATPQPHR